MSYYPAPILNLIKEIAKLPGIGEKTAERLALHILRIPRSQAQELTHSILEVKENIRLCRECFGLSEGDVCAICQDPDREDTILCVVEQPADMVAIEKSGAYAGKYLILSGALSPMNGIGPGEIRLAELLARVRAGVVKEIVLATSTSVEGEATAAYIAEQLKTYAVKVSRIASGVPMGGDLKYVDQVTLKKAMETRHDLR
jgi:recombination protein RecR